MPLTPYPWASSWYKNLQTVARFADAVSLICDASVDQHRYMLNRRALRIEDAAMRDAIVKHGAVLADLLDWIQAGVHEHNACAQIPEYFLLQERDFTLHKEIWTKHVTSANQGKSLGELKALVDALLDELRQKRSKFDSEDTGAYSSYSDYSEEETESDDNEDNEDGTRDEPTECKAARHDHCTDKDDKRQKR